MTRSAVFCIDAYLGIAFDRALFVCLTLQLSFKPANFFEPSASTQQAPQARFASVVNLDGVGVGIAQEEDAPVAIGKIAAGFMQSPTMKE